MTMASLLSPRSRSSRYLRVVISTSTQAAAPFSTTAPRPVQSILFQIQGLSNSRETQHFSRISKLSRVEHSPALQLLRAEASTAPTLSPELAKGWAEIHSQPGSQENGVHRTPGGSPVIRREAGQAPTPLRAPTQETAAQAVTLAHEKSARDAKLSAQQTAEGQLLATQILKSAITDSTSSLASEIRSQSRSSTHLLIFLVAIMSGALGASFYEINKWKTQAKEAQTKLENMGKQTGDRKSRLADASGDFREKDRAWRERMNSKLREKAQAAVPFQARTLPRQGKEVGAIEKQSAAAGKGWFWA